MASLLVVRAGLQTTVQDLGRWGFQSRGVPVAGAMDRGAHRLANALSGNEPGTATLEVTLSGPELVFEDERHVAVTGADFEMTVDGAAMPMNARVPVSAGACLRLGHRRRGARAYVAVSGGIDVPPVFGSRATHMGSGMGGFRGRALAAGDRLPLGVARGGGLPRDGVDVLRDEISALVRLPREGHRLRVVVGPDENRFTPAATQILGSASYVVGPESGRMAYRLEGPGLPHTSGADILSEATMAGAIQVPGSGAPLLLMADRQTTGGYARIAAVISADLDLAGQLAPGDTVAFEICSLRDALSALVARERALLSIETRAVR
jgi:antagonist of KipI